MLHRQAGHLVDAQAGVAAQAGGDGPKLALVTDLAAAAVLPARDCFESTVEEGELSFGLGKSEAYAFAEPDLDQDAFFGT